VQRVRRVTPIVDVQSSKKNQRDFQRHSSRMMIAEIPFRNVQKLRTIDVKNIRGSSNNIQQERACDSC
jgi:hypothetical protein